MEEEKRWLEGFHCFGQMRVCRQPRSSPHRRRRLEFYSEISRWKDMSWNSTAKRSKGSPGFLSASKDETNQCSTSPPTETSISNTPNIEQVEAESDIFNDKRGFRLHRSHCARSIFPPQPTQEDSHGKEPTSSNEKESDKCNDSSLSRTIDDHNNHRRGRGKRIPKPKLHFDELTTPEKPIRKVRRIKIMRYLGLIPPAGSPFSLPRSRNTRC